MRCWNSPPHVKPCSLKIFTTGCAAVKMKGFSELSGGTAPSWILRRVQIHRDAPRVRRDVRGAADGAARVASAERMQRVPISSVVDGCEYVLQCLSQIFMAGEFCHSVNWSGQENYSAVAGAPARCAEELLI